MSCFVNQVCTERLYSIQKDTENGATDLMSQKTFRWNKLTSKETKAHMINFFQSITKDLLLSMENEIAYF